MKRKLAPSHPFIKVTLLAISTLTTMAGASIAPALPLIQEQFGGYANVAYLTRLVLTLPALFIAGTAPLTGYLLDRVGRVRVLTVAVILYGIAGLFGYFAPSLGALLVSRALLGIAVGGTMTSATTLIADYYAGESRSRFMGLQAGVMGLGGSGFLILGGALAEIEWRLPFLMYLAAFVFLPLILIALYEPEPFEQCVEKPNPASDPAACVAEGLRPSGGFVPGAPPSSPFPLRLALTAYAIMFVTQIIFYTLPVQMPFYLRALTAASASQVGLALSAVTLFFSLGSLFYGRVAKALDRFDVMMLAVAFIGAGYLLLSLASGWAIIILGLLLGGAGLGLMIPNINVWVASESPPDLRGRVLGGLTTAVFIGQFSSPLITQPVSIALGMSGLFLGATVFLAITLSISLVGRRQLRTVFS